MLEDIIECLLMFLKYYRIVPTNAVAKSCIKTEIIVKRKKERTETKRIHVESHRTRKIKLSNLQPETQFKNGNPLLNNVKSTEIYSPMWEDILNRCNKRNILDKTA